MRNAVTLDALRTIEAINQQGSFAAAAKILFKVPSALTYTIGKLEADLGVLLFNRSRQRAVLTEAGQLVLTQGRELLLATSALEDAVQQLETGWETQLVITFDTLVPMPIIFSLVSEFGELNKLTEITVNEEVLSGSWESLLSNRAQIVVGASGELPKGNFNVIEIAQVEFCFAVSATHQLAEKDHQITAQDIKQFPSIVVADSATSFLSRSTGLLDSRRAIRVSSMAAKITAQKMGLGINADQLSINYLIF
jgi:DNA-binding transcriptional LysR family regulator